MKRAVDILLSLLILILASPLLLILIALLLILSPGNPFFFHERVGRDEVRFYLIKLRTMRPATSAARNLTVSGDRRVTAIGRILRRLKLDELPQFINVLKGDMSLVGPRPESPDYVAHFSAAQREILKYPPGLTDPATLKYRHEEKILAQFDDPVDAYIRRILPDKTAISLQYQLERTFFSDMKILWLTVLSIFKPPSAAGL